MRILLDTHAFLWFAMDDARLSKRAREVMIDPANDLLLSAASAWEIILKANSGKLRLPENPQQLIPRHMSVLSIEALPVQMEHALATHELPPLHKDPFDRLLIAQSRMENLPLLTRDHQITRYDIQSLW